MKCELCGRTPAKHGVNLHRMNPVGVKGIWRCWDCLTPNEYDSIDDFTKELDEILNAKEAPDGKG